MPGLTEIYKSKLREKLIESPDTFTSEDAIKSALRTINIEPKHYTGFIERARLKQTKYIDLDKFVKAIPTKPPPPPGKPTKPPTSPRKPRKQEKSLSLPRSSTSPDQRSKINEHSRSSRGNSPRPSPHEVKSRKSPQPYPGEEDSLVQKIRDLKDELKEMKNNLTELNRKPLNETGAAAAQRTIGIPAIEQRIIAKEREIQRATKRMERERKKMDGGYKKTNRRRKTNKRTRRCTKRKF